AKYAFIGSGPFYGVARECQLKIKEMTLLPSDSYPLMDYRHGPKSNVDEHMLIVMLCSEKGRQWESECANELVSLGGKLMIIGDSNLPPKHNDKYELKTGLSDYARAPLYLPLVQTMAAWRAINLGLNPDQPRNLTYWVATDALNQAKNEHAAK
ncbi:MAG: SIS domain-containing protein, partial [Kiritimatiellia bacterium]|nr:SIS domain-containing protein [Kiritimatiellia bacterium]